MSSRIKNRKSKLSFVRNQNKNKVTLHHYGKNHTPHRYLAYTHTEQPSTKEQNIHHMLQEEASVWSVSSY